ncbi:MAG TPA: ROK family protein [Prolixibacteraceae bacterium]
MRYYLGIEIGGTKFQAVIGDSRAKIVDRYRANVERNLGGAGIREEIKKAITTLNKYKPVAIGVGFGGPVDFENGKICTSHQISGWNNYPLASWLGKLTGLPVQVDNDANTAALAEALIGSSKKARRIFYVTLGSGMGGGMILNGQIFHGEKPGEAEIGMMPFDRNSNTMESQCCGWSVDNKIHEFARANPTSAIAKLTKGMSGGESKYLSSAIAEGDSGVLKILDETADNIAFALSYVVLLFHPKVIIIGGGLSLIGAPLFKRINESLPKYVVKSFHPVPEVKIAEHGEDVVCIGALLLAQQAFKKTK